MKKERLDKLLIDKGLAQSRERAKALVLAGVVLINGQRAQKSAAMVDPGANIELKQPDLPYVSRGGVKLAGALKAFDICVKDLTAADIGASTGGFTDCLLQHGASKVYAIDVGYGQLSLKLRNDTRVCLFERTNIRFIDLDLFDPKPDLIAIDVSFISLRLVLPVALQMLKPDGKIIALIKPQFEVGKKEVEKGGVIRTVQKQHAVVLSIGLFAREMGLRDVAVMESPILGVKGNREFLIYLQSSD